MSGEKTLDAQTLADDVRGSSAPTIGPGTRLGRYLVRGQIGAGAMGVVFEAEDPDLARPVAIKLMRGPSDEVFDTKDQARMRREARAMAAVSHPNVVDVLDFGEHNGSRFIAMELVRGSTLNKWVKGKSSAEILAAYLSAGRGLAAVHAAGLVHRDFKPDNVLVGSDGRVRVTDFGIVGGVLRRRVKLETSGEWDDATTRDGAIPGTPRYMAPEQASGIEATAPSDQFSFCVSLFEALYGVQPYAGRTFAQRAAAWGEHRIATVKEPSDVPSRARHALLRGLDPDPERRFSSMDELLAELGPRRPFRTAVPAILAVGVATIALAWVVGGEKEPTCEERATRGLEDTWNDARREEIATRAAAIPGGVILWESAEAPLRHYAARWTEARSRACGLQSRQRDLAAVCLGRRRQVLAALTESLTDAGRDALEAAAVAATKLPAPNACLDPDSEIETEPSSPELDELLAEVLVLDSLSRNEACLERAAAGLELARALGACRAEVEFLLKVAFCRHGSDPPGRVEQAFEDAYYQAQKCGNAEQAALAATVLYRRRGIRTAEPDLVATWRRHAEVAVERSQDGERHVDLLTAHAQVADSQADTAALALCDAALAKAREQDEPKRLSLARIERLRASALRKSGQLAEALEAARSALEHWETVVGTRHPGYAEALSGLGAIQAQRGDLQDAADSMERVVAIIDAAGMRGAQAAAPLGNLAVVRFRQQRYKDALTTTDKGLALARDVVGAEVVVMRLQSLRARVLARLGRFDEARAAAATATEAAREVGSTVWVREAIGHAAEVELAAGRPESAIERAREACLQGCTTTAYSVIGQAELVLGDQEAAIEALRAAYNEGPHSEVQLLKPLPPEIEAAVKK